MTAPDQSDPPPPGLVRRRHVFYLSGFDPRGPGHYHTLYREQAQLVALRGGIALDVGAMKRVERTVTRWSVSAADGTATTYDFLRWDDLIRTHWRCSDWGLLGRAIASTSCFLRHRLWHQLWRLSHGFWFTNTLPPATTAVVCLVPLAVMASVMLMLHSSGPLIAIATAAVPATLAFVTLRRLASVIKVDWILQHSNYIALRSVGGFSGLDERLDQHAAQVRTALNDPANDEVLVVGHSAGGTLAVAVAARALQLSAAPGARARLALLTLGQLIAMSALLPGSARLRDELRLVAEDPRLDWLDVGSLADGASIPLQDPLIASGLPAGRQPRLLSARLYRKIAPANYRRLRRNRFAMHFQYLMAGDTAEGFDYFAATAGPLPLRSIGTHEHAP